MYTFNYMFKKIKKENIAAVWWKFFLNKLKGYPPKILLAENPKSPQKTSDIDPEIFTKYLQRVIELRRKPNWTAEELAEYRNMREYLSGGDNYV